MRILMATAELAPLAKTGGLGDVLGGLPRALAGLGHRVVVVMPFYGHISAEKYGIEPRGDWFDARVGGDHIFGGLHRWEPVPGLTVYLVAQDNFFKNRNGIYGDQFGVYGDNHRRFIFLSHATLEVARRLMAAGEPPDVFHGHDWHTGLIPLYLAEGRAGRVIPSLMTIHNIQYQGRYGRDLLFEAGLSPWHDSPEGLELWGSLSFLKGGLAYSELITAVSRGYAAEIMTPEYGEGLDDYLRRRRRDVVGVVNGIDVDVWNPATDPLLPARYRPGDMGGKDICKRVLQQEFGLPVRPEVPLFVMVSRLIEQKGLDLVGAIMPRLMAQDVQFIGLGTGEKRFQDMFRWAARTWPDRAACRIGFDEALSHRLEAGGDFFLMPSRFEPCGLNQLYSMRYGTLPVVRAVGGLHDTVEAVDLETGEGTGFKFEHYDANGLAWAIDQGLQAWQDRPLWHRLREQIMLQDLSWEAAARDYLELYARTIRQGG